VQEKATGQRVIVYEDLRGTASTATYGPNFFLAHLPMLVHAGTPKKVLHICFGVGNSLSAVVAHAELERVDNVELSPHILHAAPYFWTNDGVLQNPKVRTIIDDGRNYLMTTPEKYDVILLEPPETFTAGVINLYTVEFYRDALARLNPSGVLMQWVPTANGSLDEERGLFRSFYDVFPHATMWWQLRGGSALLLGTQERMQIDYQRLREHFEEPRVHQDLMVSQVHDVDHFLSFMIFDEVAFADFVKDAKAITDDNTVLDFSMPRYVGSGFGLGQFAAKIQVGGGTPGTAVQDRRNTYAAMRRSPVPYLTNLGNESPEAITARIDAAAKLDVHPPPIPEADWKKMRATGEMPSSAASAVAKK
jgi:spermidine synthase